MSNPLVYLLLCVAMAALLGGTALMDQGMQNPKQYDHLKQIALGQTLARIGLFLLVLTGMLRSIALTYG